MHIIDIRQQRKRWKKICHRREILISPLLLLLFCRVLRDKKKEKEIEERIPRQTCNRRLSPSENPRWLWCTRERKKDESSCAKNVAPRIPITGCRHSWKPREEGEKHTDERISNEREV